MKTHRTDNQTRWSVALGLALLIAFITTCDSAAEPKTITKQPIKERDGMVWIPEGTFSMGCDDPAIDDAKPVHQVHLKGFWIDKTEVTNEAFAKFVKATGYNTVAERKPEYRSIAPISREQLVPGALVFTPPPRSVSKTDHWQWWRRVPGADWQHPEGPTSNLNGRMNHPVVHIAWQDAEAYAKWAGKRLPTEAEFEYAARGGLDRCRYSWGKDLKPGGQWQANIWQGEFPRQNTKEDGFMGTAPVKSFSPNGYGLFDVSGNVWEWCSDWYRPNYQETGKIESNPTGPPDSFDPSEQGVFKRVLRGGSFLCTDQYCSRYMVGARGKGDYRSSCSNVGFRCAKD